MAKETTANETKTTEKPKEEALPQSSPWWGIAALLTAWTGLMGLFIGVIAFIKGIKKSTANTANTVMGIIAVFLALGAMGFQLLFGIALLFGSDSNDLGDLEPVSGTAGSTSYTMKLPNKFVREKIDNEGDRFIYRPEDTDIVRAINIVSCAEDTFSGATAQESMTFLNEFLTGLPENTEMLSEMATSFGGVKNITLGPPENITAGPYASKGYAMNIYADHPYSNEAMYGEMHIMINGDGLCSGAWLGTKEVHEKNELNMDEALSSIKMN